MKLLVVWLMVIAALSAIVFSGAVVRFDHFWQEWEFLAAATAAVHNLFFAVVVYASRRESGEGSLHDALAGSVVTHLLLRVSLPSLCFVGTMMVVLADRDVGEAPVPGDSVILKLLLTLGGFLAVWIGDLVTRHQLAGVLTAGRGPAYAWMSYFRTRAWLIDLPFVIGYVGLIFIYAYYCYAPPHSPDPRHELLVQAFVGGASALEMMIQSAIHGFSEIGD